MINDVAWKEIIGMRNKLTHDYMGVDVEAVWLTAKRDLAPLKRAVERCRFDAGSASTSSPSVGQAAQATAGRHRGVR